MVYGMERLPRSRRRSNLQDYLFRSVLPSTPILSYDWRAAGWYASERARLSRMGRNIPFIDGQIAAVAAVYGLILVTSNRSDFEPFEGLQIEDWKDG
jgi:tRNA(fMet)-specific endonuclease VapC